MKSEGQHLWTIETDCVDIYEMRTKLFELREKMLPDLIKKGLKGRQAAKRLGVSKPLVYEWIAERSLPKRKYMKPEKS
jgi:transposase